MLEKLAYVVLRRDAGHHQLSFSDRSSSSTAHHNIQSTPCSKLCMGSLREQELPRINDCPDHSSAHQAESIATASPCGEACSMSEGRQRGAHQHR